MDLLGGKYNIATNNIPASYVNQVQVLSNHQETKVDKDVFSDDVAINIKLSDKAKLKPTGTYESAAGYGEDWLYSLSGAGMLFAPKTQAIATVKTGNIKSFAADGGKTLTGTSDPESKASELLGNLSTSQAPLKSERFLSPSDILVTLNAIRKTGRNSTIKANAGYSTSKSDYEYSQTSLYYDGSGNMQVNRSVSPESTLRKPWLSMTFQNNAPKCYINEDISLKATSRKSTVPTIQNGKMLVQSQSIRDIDLKNDFTARWRTCKLRWNASSVLEYSEAPTALSDLHFSVCPDVYFNWNVSPRSVLRATASYSRTFGDALDFLTAPVRLDETTVRVSSGVLSDTKALSANLHYDFKIPLEQWFLNADFAYVRNWNNLITSQDVIDSNILTGTLAQQNVSDNIISQLGVTKQITPIRTKISLTGSALYSNQSTMQNGNLVDVSWQSTAISPSLYSHPLDWLELDYSGEYAKTSSNYGSVRKHYLSQSHDIVLKLLPGDSFQFTAGAEISRHQITDDLTKTMALLDCGLSFRHRSMQLSLDLRNLLNQKSYSYTIYSTVNTFTYDYRLRGRELIMTLRFTL